MSVSKNMKEQLAQAQALQKMAIQKQSIASVLGSAKPAPPAPPAPPKAAVWLKPPFVEWFKDSVQMRSGRGTQSFHHRTVDYPFVVVQDGYRNYAQQVNAAIAPPGAYRQVALGGYGNNTYQDPYYQNQLTNIAAPPSLQIILGPATFKRLAGDFHCTTPTFLSVLELFASMYREQNRHNS